MIQKKIDFSWNEEETRAELIDPKLKECGWNTEQNIKIYREYYFTQGRILGAGKKEKSQKADYILEYKNRKLAVVEAKEVSKDYTEGVSQAKLYAEKLNIRFTYSTNGLKIYQVDMETGKEKEVSAYPTPEQLFKMTYETEQPENKFINIPFETKGEYFKIRYYQEIAINNVLDALSRGQNRILLTLATGTGKTAIACQIAWKLFNARWNLQNNNQRRPRILFLADRNILANQAYNFFSIFPEDAMIRIKPSEIKKKGKVPTNANIFFTIFQTFMSGLNDDMPYFKQYDKDFFDFIIIDECHRGGANDESQWRAILEYFSPAVQLGLTATPKRDVNIDTYKYFGNPVYIYSLKEGINDGFLTPFRVREIESNIDEYQYSKDDDIEGDIEEGRVYSEQDINRIIEIPEREKARVDIFMNEINQNEKTLVFCANQKHALQIRNYINQIKKSSNPNYCVRVTADDGELGEQYLREFQDNEKTVPTILTTSQKLSTGVDAKNIRNIVLLRPVNSMIEFKQIIGRGTRLFEGKEYFTIYDFVKAHKHFNDSEWDGEPETPVTKEAPIKVKNDDDPDVLTDTWVEGEDPEEGYKTTIKVQLGKNRKIEITRQKTSFWDINGRPISAEEFLNNLFNSLPDFFKNETELRKIWSFPNTRKELLYKLEKSGYDINKLNAIKDLVSAEKSDIYDVLQYIAFDNEPITRQERVENHKDVIFSNLSKNQQEFISFVLEQYINNGFQELDDAHIGDLIKLKYGSVNDAVKDLGSAEEIRDTFCNFQQFLYLKK